ncbi:hypothetical protein [Nocardioides zeae]|uniref:LppX_LprAFG lipoprotein n=1 Tax=Nocardioides zeae TaxID=1457234 RepID=A0A6P0HHR4_9ACTN|nr:hypothetical protein [Nocardioides zeae]NEN77840.1 hypothetical protein [Nocardioides zeae]
MTRRRLAALAAVPLLALPALAACSGADDGDAPAPSGSGTPPEPGAGADDGPAAAERFAGLPTSSIEAAVLQDMSEVSTVRARVRATHLGLSVDAQVAVGEAGACLATLTAGSGTAEVLRPTGMVSGIGDSADVYGAFDAAFLEEVGFTADQADGIAAAVADRWVLLDPTSGIADVALVCQAVDDARDGRLLGGEDATTEVTGLEQVDDRPVLGLERTGEAGTVSLLVAATGEHRFVQVVTPAGGSPATVDELAYDEEVVVPDPAARGVVPAAEVGLG